MRATELARAGLSSPSVREGPPRATTPMTPAGKSDRIQVLRGVAIVSVLFYHLSLTPSLLKELGFGFMTMPFYLGVDLFFVISGYVVLLSLHRSGYAVRRFVLRRVFRLYPAILCFIVLSTAVYWYIGRRFGDMPIARELFIPSRNDFLSQAAAVLGGVLMIGRDSVDYYNGAMWSLSVEFEFYAALAVVLALAAATGGWGRAILPRLIPVLAALALLTVWCYRVILYFAPAAVEGLYTPLHYVMLWNFDFLVLGVLLFYAQLWLGSRAVGIAARIAPGYSVLLVIPYVLAATLRADLVQTFGLPLAAVCFAGLVLVAAAAPASQKLPTTRGRLLMLIGDRSYTLYLLHFTLMAAVWTFVVDFLPVTFSLPLAFGVVQAALLVLVAVPVVELVYRGVELPMIRVGKLFEPRAQPQRGEATRTLPTVPTVIVGGATANGSEHSIPVVRTRLPTRHELLPYLAAIDERQVYGNFGPLNEQFERRLAEHFGAPRGAVTTVSNATQGLTLALLALDVRPGDLCMMPAWAFVAPSQAAVAAGLVPYFVDVDRATWALDPTAAQAYLAFAPGRVAAVMPAGPFGQPVDAEAWDAFATATGLAVVIDAAAGFDSFRPGRVPGVVSLHAAEVLGVGEGGLVVSTDLSLIRSVRSRSNFGFSDDRQAHVTGLNARLSEYHAAVGLASLDAWPRSREAFMRVARAYRIAVADRPDVVLQDGFGTDWISSTCVVGMAESGADAAAAQLASAGIATRRWWSTGAHNHPATRHFPRADLPVTEFLAVHTLGLPFFAELTFDEVQHVARSLALAELPVSA